MFRYYSKWSDDSVRIVRREQSAPVSLNHACKHNTIVQLNQCTSRRKSQNSVCLVAFTSPLSVTSRVCGWRRWRCFKDAWMAGWMDGWMATSTCTHARTCRVLPAQLCYILVYVRTFEWHVALISTACSHSDTLDSSILSSMAGWQWARGPMSAQQHRADKHHMTVPYHFYPHLLVRNGSLSNEQ